MVYMVKISGPVKQNIPMATTTTLQKGVQKVAAELSPSKKRVPVVLVLTMLGINNKQDLNPVENITYVESPHPALILY